MSRKAVVTRKTRETEIALSLALDGKGKGSRATGVGFLDHMLDQLAVHGGLDLDVKASGDLQVDAHHTVEDVGIVLGQALAEAVGDKAGMARFGDAAVPMEDALARAALDFCGRGHLAFRVEFPQERIGEFEACLVEEFLQAFCRHAGITLHIDVPWGSNAHHVAEAIFKSLARALRQALASTGGKGMPSTKGRL